MHSMQQNKIIIQRTKQIEYLDQKKHYNSCFYHLLRKQSTLSNHTGVYSGNMSTSD